MTPTSWSEQFSHGARAISSSAIRDLLKVTEQPDIISFAGGLPAPESFPTEELAAAAERVLVERPVAALQYGPTEGYQPLRELIAQRMERLGVVVPWEQITITSGSQQALDLLGKLFIDPGSVVLVEEPTYLGALQAWNPYRPQYISLPMDGEGLQVDALTRVLESGVRPRFLYLVSCFQNPTGVTLSNERRAALIKVATQYNLLIVEDDPYGELCYTGQRPPILASLDVQLHGQPRNVVYLSTFSKLLSPGLRLGWVIAPHEIVGKFVHAKQGMDLHTGSLAQAIAYEACRDGLLERHIPTIRDRYHLRRDTMLAALDTYMPTGVEWTKPGGGMFLWLTLPSHLNSTQLLEASIERRVVFVPGEPFYANGGGANTFRLNFSHSTPAVIEDGVERLAKTIAEML